MSDYGLSTMLMKTIDLQAPLHDMYENKRT